MIAANGYDVPDGYEVEPGDVVGWNDFEEYLVMCHMVSMQGFRLKTIDGLPTVVLPDETPF